MDRVDLVLHVLLTSCDGRARRATSATWRTATCAGSESSLAEGGSMPAAALDMRDPLRVGNPARCVPPDGPPSRFLVRLPARVARADALCLHQPASGPQAPLCAPRRQHSISLRPGPVLPR